MDDRDPSPAWPALAPPGWRCLELARETVVAGGLPVGAVLVDRLGEIVAEGRNRCYDPPTGRDPLEGTPLAHAELNAIAKLSTDDSTDRLTL